MSRRATTEPVPPPSFGRRIGVVGLLSALAVVLSIGAIVLTLTRTGDAAAGSCHTLAWDSLPVTDRLPSGWSRTSSGFLTDGAVTRLVGPVPADSSTGSPTIDVNVTCYGADSASVVTRYHDDALAAGGSDIDFAKVGDASFATQDTSTGSISVVLRQGSLVANLAASAGVDVSDLQLAARAVDDAMVAAHAGAPIRATAAGSPVAGAASGSPEVSLAPSDEPSAAPVHEAPNLEKLVPLVAGTTKLESQSTTGASGLGADPSSQALIASLTGHGKKAADLQIAEAYDPAGASDIQIVLFRLAGVSGPILQEDVISSWLAAGMTGITTSKVTVSGKPLTLVDYGDEGPLDYVFNSGNVVYDISTADASLAAQVIKKLP